LNIWLLLGVVGAGVIGVVVVVLVGYLPQLATL
jgi:hypothetical protein